MATRKIVPRADNEGGIGTALKRWATAFITAITCTTINALTLAAAAVGFTIAGGTTSKTLTVDETVAMSSKAPKASPVFTGDVTLAGKVVNSTLPAFLAHLSAAASNVSGDGTVYTIIFGTEVFDQAGNFDGISTFTAPVTGKYRFSVNIRIEGLAAAHTGHILELITSNRTYSLYSAFPSNANPLNNTTLQLSALADMDLGDTAIVTLRIDGGTKIVSITSGINSYFCGELVC